MEILHIFEHIEQKLLAIHYKGEVCNCFELCFQRWSDVEYLEEFFEENKKYIEGEFWKESVETAVLKTLEESKKFKQYLLDVANEKESKTLDEVFIPLAEKEPITKQKSKTYGTSSPSWLRLYAIRLGPNTYIITGGALKLTKKMNEGNHTKTQLSRLDFVREYLKEMGIEDNTDYGYLHLEK